jgi:Family of unknown function (DUF6510)
VSLSEGNIMVELDQSDALDGSAAAGAFSSVFGVDATMINIICAECGHQAPFAEERAYLEGPGTTLCCQRCANVIGRLATTPAGTWLSLSGSESWRLPILAGQ